MKKAFKKIAIAAALVIAAGSAAQADDLTSAGYSQNFDSMLTGSALPDSGWTAWNITTGADSHTQWETSIAPGDVGGGTQITTVTAMTDTSITSGTKSATTVYNMADATVGTSNRALATSPTGDDGLALQLTLTNTTGSAVSNINMSYNIKTFYAGNLQSSLTSGLPNNEELPGYQLFYSVNGGAFTNVAAFNPVASNVANPNGQPVIQVGTPSASGTNGPVFYTVTNVSGNITLAQAVAAGSTLTFRWVDDNAVNISPDQVIGLDDVNITPTPIPAAAWLLGSGLMGLIGFRRRTG